MLEISRVGVAESDDEIELSLELSIGGSYGKCGKPRHVIEGSLSRDKNNERGVEDAVPRAGFSFSEASGSVGGEQVEGVSIGSVPEAVDPNRRREIQALRRLEARRKREEKMRKSTVNFRGINANDKVCLEAQQSQERAQDRKFREVENFLDDHSCRKKATLNGAPRVTNEGMAMLKKDESAIPNHGVMQMRGHQPLSQCMPLKNGCVYSYGGGGAPSLGCVAVKKEVNEMKETYMIQPVASGSYRPYLNGTRDIVRQSFGTNLDSGHINCGISRIVNQKATSNGSLERSSSPISDYRSTSGKGGSMSDTGSHSSCSRRQLSITATSDALNQPEANASWNKETMQEPKNSILKKELGCVIDTTAANSKSGSEANAATLTPENPISTPPKQSFEVLDNPSKNEAQNGGRPTLPQMPCVSTTGNGPNGKTITGFLYRYTKAEVSIVCVCHGSSFSPAEFVEHAGGTDVTNPLRHITMVPSSFG